MKQSVLPSADVRLEALKRARALASGLFAQLERRHGVPVGLARNDPGRRRKLVRHARRLSA
jgi:hypothetical protein